jgi:hypothetical protein
MISCGVLVTKQLLSVEKKDYSWFFGFSGSVSISTESPWRLTNEDRIGVTSEDDGHQFGLSERVDAASRVLSVMVGRTVEAASIDPSSGDLTISFDGRTRLQLLQMSSGYESWRLSAPGYEIICTGGGEITQLPSTPQA